MKIKPIICSLLVMLVLAGCGGAEKSAQFTPAGKSFYLDMAQMYIDQGNTEAAIHALQDGLEQSNDPELYALLEQLTATEPTEPEFILPTEPATVPTTAPEKRQVLSSENQRRINIFLSNFAEQSITSYPDDDYSMLMFAYRFCKINMSSKVHSGENGYYINKKDMDTVLADYLGATVYPQSDYAVFEKAGHNTQIIFEDDRYVFPYADGAMCDYLAIVSSLVDNGDGTYLAEFNIYEVPYGVHKDHYEMSMDDITDDCGFEWLGYGYATVRDHVRSTGTQSYILLDYHVN